MPTPAATSKDSAADSIEARILDAALIQFERVGVKKTTIEDIAKQAAVDRVTVYRRVGSRDDVVRAVTAREVRRILDELNDIAARHDTLDAAVADVFATVVTRWRTHPLVDRLLTLEPDRLIPQLTTDGAVPFTLAVTATTAVLRNLLQANDFPDIPDLPTRVEIACRVVHSLILQPVGQADLTTEAELTAFARTYIVPIITR
ncbi:TetR/AcrR family transcriptional regulator [Nocardia sp. 2]|uniref:TetR/AcrR family transcriptional regulator n=1 Tax=Nocardia acididurans TaxID=2802282 RepID=A0ABS1M1D5_9NOCA|nr:TetR/AcrR family transcriptional regulator [Nocardia acididurans]MBL1074458.1 TetR/AcrR family transcriptional regulator [Nocardia acididurans]